MKTTVVRILVFVVLALANALTVVYRDRFDLAAFEAWVADAGALAPLLFMMAGAASGTARVCRCARCQGGNDGLEPAGISRAMNSRRNARFDA